MNKNVQHNYLVKMHRYNEEAEINRFWITFLLIILEFLINSVFQFLVLIFLNEDEDFLNVFFFFMKTRLPVTCRKKTGSTQICNIQLKSDFQISHINETFREREAKG